MDLALRALAAQAAIGRLATVTAGGLPHVVPVCFAVTGDLVYSAVDHKPKSSHQLKRVDNIRLHPAAELLIDHYEEDWTRLWWVRATGTAAIVTDPNERTAGVDLLVAKYEQYRAVRPTGILLRLKVTRWRAWRGAPS